MSTIEPHEYQPQQPVARVGVDKLPLPRTLGEVIADGIITRVGSTVPTTDVTSVQLGTDENTVRIVTSRGTQDFDALVLATIDGDTMRWVAPEVAERGLGIPELTTTEPQPLRDELFTAACALFNAGPVVLIPRAATQPARGVWKRVGSLLSRWTTEEPAPGSECVAVLVNGTRLPPREAILAASTFLINKPNLARRALATYLHRNPARIELHVHPHGHLVGIGDADLDSLTAKAAPASAAAQASLVRAMGNTPPRLSDDMATVAFPNAATARCVPIATVTAGTWTWAWADGTLPQSAAFKLRLFGERHGIFPLVATHLAKSVADDLKFTEVAKAIFGLPGHAWVPLTDTTSVLVLFHPLDAGL
ncbi:hypothetical protein J7S19_08300 [Corynebacterium pyruviciproducens]|uniref:DUF6882 domain-containing protein n=1 Tax=Corynebacterium pyruviciproducens TaxID=598660 RepID=UPI002453F023|nr:DUF6882 domain-containing protein [Corynebacterium pyruviciproducens]MDH4658603.1 hypothetical protein [Corynebacterium pyruviciproducens]